MSAIYDFAALRFTEDQNISDRVYWYAVNFSVKENEEVLAPVGPHDRLQKARVERTLSATAETAPYDIKLIKYAAAKYGARGLRMGSVLCREFGGVRYDSRHYTRFGAVLLAEDIPDANALKEYGNFEVFTSPEIGDDCVYRALILGHGAFLIGGEGKNICRLLFSLVKGEEDARNFLRGLGFTEGEIYSLTQKLG